MHFLGYERPDGQAGVRNWIGVISVMDNVNPITRAVCGAVAGTIPITTLFVRGQYGRDLKVSLDSLGGMGRNPNLAGAVVIGLEEDSTGKVAERIANSGKPVETVILQQTAGSIAATAEGIEKATRLALDASRHRRKKLPASMLTLGVECGGSDTTSGLASNPAIGRAADRLVDDGGTVIISETSEFLGAEDLFAARAIDDGVRKAFLGRILGHEEEAMKRGLDIRGANPVADNIKGGLSTIEEKALGAMAKAGTRPLVGVLDYGEAPSRKGMHFMATPAPAVESMTAFAASGCQIIMFSTGQGNIIGNMVSPTMKISGNPKTVAKMPINIDFDVCDILTKGTSISEVGDRLYGEFLEVASGTKTSSEVLNQRETAISRFEPSI
jgi:altronate dehydratase large subunit